MSNIKKGNLKSEQKILEEWFEAGTRVKEKEDDFKNNAKKARKTLKASIKKTEACEYLRCSIYGKYG